MLLQSDYPGFLSRPFKISLQQYCICLASVSVFININKNTNTKEIQYSGTEIQMWPGRNPVKSLCGSMPAEKLGQGEICFGTILHGREFYCPGDIFHTPMDSVQPRWPPDKTTINLNSLLELFTQLDHRPCTSLRIGLTIRKEEHYCTMFNCQGITI